MDMDESLNVFGEKLEPCNEHPVTGFFRDGCCNTNAQDIGSHTVCTVLSKEFLEFSKASSASNTAALSASLEKV